MFREATDALHKQMLKGTRWLLLMGEDTLDSPQRIARRKPGQPSDREKLDAALKLNEPLATAYYLKEKLRCSGISQTARLPNAVSTSGAARPKRRASASCTRWWRR
ncbi:hypothetical protein GC176_19255 [bacterium]|nr:hypothetical protein [bacterium]